MLRSISITVALVALPAAALATPSAAPPRARGVWTSTRVLDVAPPAVEGHVVVGDRLVGGITPDGIPLVEDWKRSRSGYGPVIWEPRPSAPAPVLDAAAATSADSELAILFGGRNGEEVFGDTWRLRDDAWTLTATSGPSPRHRHAMAAAGGAIYLLGGLGESDGAGGWDIVFDVFWKFEGNAWRPLDRLGGFPGRYDHAMVGLPSGDLILHGGRIGPASRPSELHDTWRYDGVDWTLVSETGGPGGHGFDLRYDPVIDGVVACDGTRSWILRDDVWLELPTDPSGSGDPSDDFRFGPAGAALGGTRVLAGERTLTIVVRPANDCDADGIDDDVQIAAGAADCDHDGVLDRCELAAGAEDCDGNGILDVCEAAPTYTSGADLFQVRYGWASPFHDQMVLGRFTVPPGGETLETVWYPYSPIGSNAPDVMRLGIWRDDAGTGFIEDATLLREIPLERPTTSTPWARFDFDPVSLGAEGTRFFVGIASRRTNPGSPCISTYLRRQGSAPLGGDGGWIAITSGIFDFAEMSTPAGSNQIITNLVAFEAPWEASVATIQLRIGPASPLDQDGDFALDECGSCPADLDGDGEIGGSDLGLLFLAWGSCPDCPADLDADDEVGGGDLGLLFLAWGDCP
ncbi:MAG: kelch repeat-containing protein [Planctomycetota bacterium]|nr:kelch repeat-containing protein [Planctomycetota bacterium]